MDTNKEIIDYLEQRKAEIECGFLDEQNAEEIDLINKFVRYLK